MGNLSNFSSIFSRISLILLSPDTLIRYILTAFTIDPIINTVRIGSRESNDIRLVALTSINCLTKSGKTKLHTLPATLNRIAINNKTSILNK